MSKIPAGITENDDGSFDGSVIREAWPNRVTIVDSIYHSVQGQDPVSFEFRFNIKLDSDEQIYVRSRIKCPSKWIPLDTGWIEDCSVLIIENKGWSEQQYIPTEKEEIAERKRVVELAYVNKGGRALHKPWIVPVGSTTKLFPSSLENLCIRCAYKETRISLIAIPK